MTYGTVGPKSKEGALDMGTDDMQLTVPTFQAL